MVERSAGRLVRDALSDTPVVLIQGPRQVGKTTLAQEIARERFGGAYVTLDDPVALSEANANPAAFLASRKTPMVIDEVQRAPGLFLPMKLAIDKDRKPGQYLLSGSANVLLLPKVADSLAGRLEPVDLLPFSQSELAESSHNFTDWVFDDDLDLERGFPRCEDLTKRMASGGFPEVVSRQSHDRREAWFQSYVRTLLDRDVRDLAHISGLTQMPRLLALLAARSGSPLNISSLAVDTGIPHTTLTRYVDLLKALLLLQFVPAWSSNLDVRLAKSPKAYVVDTGLLCYLCGMNADSLASDWLRLQPALETFVANELGKLVKVGRVKPWLFHLRTAKQKEVDFVLESRSGKLVGIEVRASQAVGPDDLEGLRFLSELAEGKFHRGIVLYSGHEAKQVGDRLYALPMSALWG